jgi:Type III restriction enzyme, res subunit
VNINLCSAPCGSGKTYQLIDAAWRIAHLGEIVLFFQPTKELIDKTIADQLLQRSNAPAHRTFYGASPGRSVAREITEYLRSPMDGGHIVFATHQVLPFVRFWANQGRLHVFIDEELQVVKHGCFQVPNTHELVTKHIELETYDAIYERVIISDPDQLEQIAKNKASDEIYERFRETAQISVNPHWDSFINAEQFAKLRSGTIKQPSIHSILNPDILDGFASVTMACANFKDTLLYRIWSRQGVRFEEDKSLGQSLRFRTHEKRPSDYDKISDRPYLVPVSTAQASRVRRRRLYDGAEGDDPGDQRGVPG